MEFMAQQIINYFVALPGNLELGFLSGAVSFMMAAGVKAIRREWT
jgi:hypothetical protein